MRFGLVNGRAAGNKAALHLFYTIQGVIPIGNHIHWI